MAKPPKKKELTDKEYAFVMEYLIDYNGARAARACGYDPNKPQNAPSTAYHILTKPHIKQFIADHKAKLLEKVTITEQDILTLCQEILSAKVTDYIDLDDLEVTTLTKNSPNLRAIESVKVIDKDGMRREEIKLRDPLRAAERAAKLLGLDKQSDEVVDREINININYNKQDK